MFETIIIVAGCILLPILPELIAFYLLSKQEQDYVDDQHEYDYR